jgi:hypothetical protein
MDKIYTSAILTVVAAAGDNHRLPGVRLVVVMRHNM